MTMSRGAAVLTLLLVGVAGCDVSVRPAPKATVVPAPQVVLGEKIDAQHGNLELSATLTPVEGPGTPDGEDALYHQDGTRLATWIDK